MVQDKFNKQIYFFLQVLEYHPEPWNQWVTVGNILVARVGHTVLSIGPQQLPCASGDDKKLKNYEEDFSLPPGVILFHWLRIF